VIAAKLTTSPNYSQYNQFENKIKKGEIMFNNDQKKQLLDTKEFTPAELEVILDSLLFSQKYKEKTAPPGDLYTSNISSALLKAFDRKYNLKVVDEMSFGPDPLKGKPVSKLDLLKHYATKEPQEFFQYDGFYTPPGEMPDSCCPPDEDGDWICCIDTCELMSGTTDVRVLISPSTDRDTALRQLKKIRELIEGRGH